MTIQSKLPQKDKNYVKEMNKTNNNKETNK